MLITADSGAVVERIARRIHAASDRAALPFVQIAAAALPLDPAALTERCASLLDAACGGTALLTDVEQTPAIVQDTLIDTLTRLQAARERRCGVRLIAGTTTALYERVAAGTFSERLFYRLNSIHVRATSFEGDDSQVLGPSHSVTTVI
jgi:DNA-binding NtrC family response regulator